MYELIYADPPWAYGNTVSNGAATEHYPTMSITDLKRLPVWTLAAENAVLALWYTGTHNREAIELAEAWGFTVRTMKGFTWIKLNQLAEQRITKALQEGGVTDFYDFLELLNAETRMNGGNHTRANSEDLLIATKGTGLERRNAAIKQVVYSPLGAHSEKPWEVRRRLETLYGEVSRIELFARSAAPGWDCWGNECENSVQLFAGEFLRPDSTPVPLGLAAFGSPLTGDLIWSSEVNQVVASVPGTGQLPEHLLTKLKANVNRLFLERHEMAEVVRIATSLVVSMGVVV
ncbi:TPA: adenine methyltransferase [Klebsiella aerogenes]|nr:adenine methyltransferase [Klebsiella aerogenes]